MPFDIPPALYDGQMHDVPFTVGQDFCEKWDALRRDGFTVCLADQVIHACKIQPGDPLPKRAKGKPRPPSALGYNPKLPNGDTDWLRFCLQLVTYLGAGRDDYTVTTLTFPDKPAALAHAKSIGATLYV